MRVFSSDFCDSSRSTVARTSFSLSVLCSFNRSRIFLILSSRNVAAVRSFSSSCFCSSSDLVCSRLCRVFSISAACIFSFSLISLICASRFSSYCSIFCSSTTFECVLNSLSSSSFLRVASSILAILADQSAIFLASSERRRSSAAFSFSSISSADIGLPGVGGSFGSVTLMVGSARITS
uniref:(northern house mosquito) hypothetical protein n=1 Tax=Culex pipiens TaxID=7175 RepID=A0A8D8MNZ6_CULPI